MLTAEKFPEKCSRTLSPAFWLMTNFHGHIPMESQTCCGLRLSLTSPSMMVGSWVSIRVLHCSSSEAPRRLPRVWHSSLKNATIWSSVVSLVMKLSRSVMMSMQMEQVSSFLLLGTACEEATRAERRKRAAFILLLSSELFCDE